MDYLTIADHCLEKGTSLLALGAFTTSLGWFLLARMKNIKKYLKHHLGFMPKIIYEIAFFVVLCFLFIFGPGAIGKGGKLTTQGWNLLDKHEQKEALIVGLAREWLFNEIDYKFGAMSQDVNDPNFGEEHFMYPEFMTSTQERILTSELFDINDPKDKRLILAVYCYNHIIKDINAILALQNEACTRFPENVKKKKRKKTFLAIRDEMPLYMHFKKYHKEISKLLSEEYSWALDRARESTEIPEFDLYQLPE